MSSHNHKSNTNEDETLRSKNACEIFPYYDVEKDDSKIFSYSPISDGASEGTIKTTQLSPLSFGSTFTPPTSPTILPYSSSLLTPKSDLNLNIAFCESDEYVTTASKQMPIPSIHKISRRNRKKSTNDLDIQLSSTYRLMPLSHPDDSKFGRQYCTPKLPSETYNNSQYSISSYRALGLRALVIFMLFMMTCCSVVTMFLVIGRLTHHSSDELNSVWEIKASEFRSLPSDYFRRNMLNPTGRLSNNAVAHTLVSGLRPIYRFDKVERNFGCLDWKRGLGKIDSSMYSTKTVSKPSNIIHPRLFNAHMNRNVDSSNRITARPLKRYIDLYPAEYSDNTQLYGIRSSDDEALSSMEVGATLNSGECLPMKEWQDAYYPSCNEIHALDMKNLDGDVMGRKISLLGANGFWRNVWKVDATFNDEALSKRETLVLKTLKYSHNFEHAQYERDRIEAIAMDRLTASPHVVNIYGFCGRTVLNEFANGPGLGSLADKSKKYRFRRLQIARDIASGLADVHGVDTSGGKSTIAHMDINPANVVVVDNNLKINDFNIAVMLKLNRTSSAQCGFPAQYPNPQWRSPEEANKSQHLTEKIDVFSLGHIFFRTICGHEPWNKLEKGGRPTEAEITQKVKTGKLPQIPEEIRLSKDPEIKTILFAMLACYTTDPTERPSSRAIANFLDKEWQRLSRDI